MASVSDRRDIVTNSKWGVYGEDIIWPPGFSCLKRLAGSAAHGETWTIRDDIPEAIAKLESKSEKIQAGLSFIEKEIVEIKDRKSEEVDRLESRDDWDLMESRHKVRAAYGDTFDPYAEQEIYGGTEDSDEEEQQNNNKNKVFNPHDYEDFDALLAEKNSIKIEMESLLEDVKEELNHLLKSRFQMEWKKKEIPAQLIRLDAPWIQFAEKELKEDNIATRGEKSEGDAWSHKGTRVSQGKGKKKDKTTHVTTDDTQPPPKLEYCAKLITPGIVEAADGRRFTHSDAVSDKSAIRNLVNDGEELLVQQWRVIIGQSKEVSFDSIGLLPLVVVMDVERRHANYQNIIYCAAFVSPHCKNGSVSDAVSRVAGRRLDYWFEDDFILENLKTHIRTMALLQHRGISHGNIKPSNVFISDDGYHILIAELKRWFADLARSLTNVPTYFSPELYDSLVNKKVKHLTKAIEQIDIHKHDVFCLGLIYFLITTRTEPKNFFKDVKYQQRALGQLKKEKHKEELVDILSKMLAFDHTQRPTFWDLLSFTERVTATGRDVLGVIRGLLGINDEATSVPTNTTRQSEVAGRAQTEREGYCSTQ